MRGMVAGRPAVGAFSRRVGFTLVELLIVVTVLGLLATLSLGALQKARDAARMTRTKATIAKIHNIIMRKYEAYGTRRVPLDMSGISLADRNNRASMATERLHALRDIMRMEMPDCYNDIEKSKLSSYLRSEPALWRQYRAKCPQRPKDHESAKFLYMVVMAGDTENRAAFNADEINTNIDGDGLPVFVDGWGRPIGWLRWAPGFSRWSTIQVADADLRHDPFDSAKVDASAYHLIPVIFAGAIRKKDPGGKTWDDYGLKGTGRDEIKNRQPTLEPFKDAADVGQVIEGMPITNHLMESR